MSNKFFHILVLMAVASFVLPNCRKGFGNMDDIATDKMVQYQFTVNFPDFFNTSKAYNTTVLLRNQVTQFTVEVQANAEGVATIPGLLPGVYSVEASRFVPATEAATLTPYTQDIYLSAGIRKLYVREGGDTSLNLSAALAGDLVFKQVYYTGSRTPSNGSYFSDQFYEIYNNSADTVYADSLCIADIGGAPGNNLSARPWGFQSDPNYTYVQNIWMVPTSEEKPGKTYPIAPGESIIIAQDGINHKTDPLGNPASPVNLGVGIGDFETYVPRADNRDLDAPGVPNMIPVYTGSVGFDWLTSVFGSSVIIFKHSDPASLPRFTEPGSTSSTQHAQIPNFLVLDAVEGLASSQAVNFKRIPSSLDGGFVFCSGTYVGEGKRRKVAEEKDGRKILQDTNNSTADFEMVKPPTPKSW